MNWYIAQIVFKIEKNAPHANEFDLQWRMINASDKQHAFSLANSIGKAEEGELKSAVSQVNAWQFIAVTELQVFDHLHHGSHLFSFTESPASEPHFESQLKQKQSGLLESIQKHHLS
jgi:hypothetical protein